jgi:hypothetical protein
VGIDTGYPFFLAFSICVEKEKAEYNIMPPFSTHHVPIFMLFNAIYHHHPVGYAHTMMGSFLCDSLIFLVLL